MRRLEALKQDGLGQTDLLIRVHFGLTEEEVWRLSDEEYTELAAQAYFLEEREAELVKLGVLKAIGEIFRRR